LSAGFSSGDRVGAWASSGDAGDGNAPDPDTVFRIASCTKSFTAARALQLRDAGKLDLDRPITELLPIAPRLLLPTADSPVPTPRMLLTMSAGLPTDDAWADRLESMPSVEFDALLTRGIRFSSVPGTRYEYANLGWAILGRILEALDGRGLPEQIEAEVLDPLGLDGVRFAEPRGRRVAIGHAMRAHGWESQPVTKPGSFSAIGGLFASSTELLRWAAWLASAFDTTRDRSTDHVLSAESRREMQQLHRFDQSAAPEVRRGYGYGLVVEHSAEMGQVIGHSGGYPGFSAHMRWSVEQPVAVCGFENGGYTGVFRPVHAAFRELMCEALSQAGNAAARLTSEVVSDPDPEPWPETLAAVDRITALIDDGGQSVSLWQQTADEWFDSCIALDRPFAERREQLAQLLGDPPAVVGASLRHHSPVFPTPARAVWHTEGANGIIAVAIDMTPAEPPRVQRFTVTALENEATP
jgi:CubicO group peptidase (beta-lactamase class C family)